MNGLTAQRGNIINISLRTRSMDYYHRFEFTGDNIKKPTPRVYIFLCKDRLVILYLLRLWALATAPTMNTLTTFAQTRSMKSDQFGHRICGALCMWSDRRAGGVLGGTPGYGKRHSGLPGPLHTRSPLAHILDFFTSPLLHISWCAGSAHGLRARVLASESRCPD